MGVSEEPDDTKIEVKNNSTVRTDAPKVVAEDEVASSVPFDIEKEEFVVPQTTAHVPKKSSGAKKWLLGGLVIVLLAGLGALTYYFYSVEQTDKQQTDQATNQLTTANATVANLRSQLSTNLAKDDQPVTSADIQTAYNKIEANSVVVSATDKTAIFDAVKAYYKLSSLPDGTAVLAMYQLAKPFDATNNDSYALIYYPAGDTKPAIFFDMIKAKGTSTWKYNAAQ